ncbi:MAG: hypothetical protein IKT68_05685 [Clostridia bacterium]|nr:hypothetical protein [Clostridia bacterium]
MKFKRLTLLAGHYGSGKTNIAVNLAFELKKQADRVAIGDLDIVNPYFRTKDSAQGLAEAGVSLICSPYANTNVDIPALPQEMYALTDDQTLHAIVDIGGDDRGALALGRYAPAILEENNYDMWLVVNRYRPLTSNVADTLEVMNEILVASKIPFTGIVNNSNLGADTTEETILSSVAYGQAVAEASGLPLIMTTVQQKFFESLKNKIPDLFPLGLQSRVFDKQ